MNNRDMQDILAKPKQLLKDQKPHLLNNRSNWPMVEQNSIGASPEGINIDLTDGVTGLLADVARNRAAVHQFPVSTTFLHYLGLFSACCTLRFTYKMRENGEHSYPIVFTASSQPSSAGKTGVHNAVFSKMQNAFGDMNRRSMKEARRIRNKIDTLKEEMKAQPKGMSAAIDEINEQIRALEDDYSALEFFTRWTSDDPTPESLVGAARDNNGYMTVLSDEGQAILTLLGGQYSTAGKASNANIILKGYDNSFMSPTRAKDARDPKSKKEYDDRATAGFHIRLGIASLAQTESIDAIVDISTRGIGVGERFFLLEEPILLGLRNFIDNSAELDAELDMRLYKLINNVLSSGAVNLHFSQKSKDYINQIRQKLEPLLAQGQRFGYKTLQGWHGKVERHITAIAALLHISEEWSPDGERKQQIGHDKVVTAMYIFRKLSDAFCYSFERRGAAGSNSEIEEVYKKLLSHIERKKTYFITYRELRDQLKGRGSFKSVPDVTKYLRENALLKLQHAGACLAVKSGVYINPNIK